VPTIPGESSHLHCPAARSPLSPPVALASFASLVTAFAPAAVFPLGACVTVAVAVSVAIPIPLGPVAVAFGAVSLAPITAAARPLAALA